ncbi:MAG: hypothetical protein Q9183_002574 [Haloplaca sp. 2 TL-2023]
MTDDAKSNQKSYHKKATGAALVTVKKHSKEHDLKLYGSCFCPFVQRVWISLQLKGIEYQYIEVDPYKKPDSLTAINPRGLVPALRHGNWGCYESTVLMEYVGSPAGFEVFTHLMRMRSTERAVADVFVVGGSKRWSAPSTIRSKDTGSVPVME